MSEYDGTPNYQETEVTAQVKTYKRVASVQIHNPYLDTPHFSMLEQELTTVDGVATKVVPTRSFPISYDETNEDHVALMGLFDKIYKEVRGE